MIGVFVGVPLTLIGAYLIYKKFKNSDEIKEEKPINIEANLDQKIAEKQKQLNDLDVEYENKTQEKEKELKTNLLGLNRELENTQKKYQEVKKELDRVEEDLEMQEYGLYEPKYNFINATDYKEKLNAIRKQQKQMMKDKTAAIGATGWTIDGSKSKGKAFINANIKQILRSFNNETEVI